MSTTAPSLRHGALVVDVDVSDREVGARRVGSPAELASDHHALDGPRRVPERARDLDRRARVLALESVVVEENSAMVLGDHVEVLRQGPFSVEARHFLHTNHMPRAVEVTCQRARVRRAWRGQDSRKEAVSRRFFWSGLSAGAEERCGDGCEWSGDDS